MEQQQSHKLGERVEKFCEACKEERGHVVASLTKSGNISRVSCPVCGTRSTFRADGGVRARAAASPGAPYDPARTYREIRATFETEFERNYVSWLLGRHDGNISAAAREAKMDRKYLYDLARKHGLRNAKE